MSRLHFLVRSAFLATATLSLFAMTLPGLAASSPTGASVAPGTRVGNSIVVQAGPGSVVLTAAPGVAKADFHPRTDLRSLLLAPFITSSTSNSAHSTPDGSVNGNTVTLSGFQAQSITPPNGSAAPEDTQFQSSDYYNVPCCFNDELKFSGSAMGDWDGSNPSNADTVSLAETYEVTGVSITFNASGPGFTGSGSTASWNGSVSNNWTIYHSFSGSPDFHGTYMWDAYEYATTTLQFGSNFYTVGANDSVALP